MSIMGEFFEQCSLKSIIIGENLSIIGWGLYIAFEFYIPTNFIIIME